MSTLARLSFDLSDGLPSPFITGILQGREGGLWFATYGGGVSRYDGETFVTFTTEDGLADHCVHCMLEDQEGVLWFGTGQYYSAGGGARLTKEGIRLEPVPVLVKDAIPSMISTPWGILGVCLVEKDREILFAASSKETFPVEVVLPGRKVTLKQGSV